MLSNPLIMNPVGIISPLQEAISALRTRQDPNVVIQIVLHVACRLANAVHGSFIRVDFEKNALRIEATYGDDWTTETRGANIPIGDGITGTVAKTGKPYLCRNVFEDPNYITLFDYVQSELAVPVWVGDRVWGIINLDGLIVDAFDDHTVDVMMMFSELVAMAFTLERELREFRALQEELLQSQKLASLGKVIAGIAHEINNPLTTILGHSSLLQLDPNKAPDPVSLHAIASEAQRAADIVKSLLDFSRKEAGELRRVTVKALLEKITDLKKYQIRNQEVRLLVEPFDSTLQLHINSQQIQQVLFNLIHNAEQALEQSSQADKQITIRVESIAGLIRIRIVDNGPGIPEEARPYIFDPFFSTKGVKGTGIGLSMCHTLMSAHQGRIYLENTSSEGTSFVVELPDPERLEAAMGSSTTPVKSESPIEDPIAPRGKILLVDDEQSILEYLSKVCRFFHLKPVTALDGDQALEKIRDHGRFDVIISDVRMPNMSGLELYQRVSNDDPDYSQRFIFISGDLNHQGTRTQVEETGCPFLEKPFTPSVLQDVLIPLLERSFAPAIAA